MLTLKEKGLLFYIINHCTRIEDKIIRISKEDFINNNDAIDIVCFNVLQIGELVKKLPDNFLVQYDKIPWKKIKGLRDRVAHGYDTLDLETIWDTASDDITPLKDYCKEILSINNAVTNDEKREN